MQSGYCQRFYPVVQFYKESGSSVISRLFAIFHLQTLPLNMLPAVQVKYQTASIRNLVYLGCFTIMVVFSNNTNKVLQIGPVHTRMHLKQLELFHEKYFPISY